MYIREIKTMPPKQKQVAEQRRGMARGGACGPFGVIHEVMPELVKLDGSPMQNLPEPNFSELKRLMEQHLLAMKEGPSVTDSVKREFFKEGIESFDAYVFNYSLKKINKEENTLEGIL